MRCSNCYFTLLDLLSHSGMCSNLSACHCLLCCCACAVRQHLQFSMCRSQSVTEVSLKHSTLQCSDDFVRQRELLEQSKHKKLLLQLQVSEDSLKSQVGLQRPSCTKMSLLQHTVCLLRNICNHTSIVLYIKFLFCQLHCHAVIVPYNEQQCTGHWV